MLFQAATERSWAFQGAKGAGWELTSLPPSLLPPAQGFPYHSQLLFGSASPVLLTTLKEKN